jgi:acetolactate decarboxylase
MEPDNEKRRHSDVTASRTRQARPGSNLGPESEDMVSEQVAVTSGRRSIYQQSTIGALMDGVYDGALRVSELLRHGDFGLGTFNALDGEMVVLDGIAYQILSDGSASPASLDALTPFALVMPFVPSAAFDVDRPRSREEVVQMIRDHVRSENYPFAVRVHGLFRSVLTRTVARQERPYRPLRVVAREAPMTSFSQLPGTIAGFRTPVYQRDIGVPGGHVHFLSDDRTRGGHVFDFVLEHGRVDVCVATDFHLRLPLHREFESASLVSDDMSASIDAVENANPADSGA